MTDERLNARAIENVITRVLEERRDVAVPEGFASRVRSRLPAKPMVRRRMSVGKTIAIVMAVLAMSAMFGLAPHAAGGSAMGLTNLAFDTECLLMVQLAGIMTWLALRKEL